MSYLGRSLSDVTIDTAIAGTNVQSPAITNSNTQDYARGTVVSELVARQAADHPDERALVACNEAVTYSELDKRAGQIARYLLSQGFSRNTSVGIYLERSINFVISALGVLKAGGAYVPLDPAHPPDRIAWTLKDVQPVVVLTRCGLAEQLPEGKWSILHIDSEWARPAPNSSQSMESIATSEDLAYIIYTSGSTGKPKGVQIGHDNLSNLVSWHQKAFGVNASDRASQLASPAFDAAVWEVWPYLTAGASVYFPDDGVRSDPESLRHWLLSNNITIAFVPTPLAERLIRLKWPSDAPLRFLLTGADTLRSYPPPNLPFVLINNYGPTECTVVATSGPVPADGARKMRPSIGWPISNVQIYIVNEQLEQVPVGVTGEIYIGGAGVGRGYINAPDLNAEKFVFNRFSSQQNSRLYKTGDLGYCLPDGQIAFQGRIDDQIKIRGYRVEPNEIIASLITHPMVEASAVIAREDHTGDKQLVAYIVLSPEAELTERALRDFLNSQLPEYMVPTLFVRMSSLPVNASGKVDHASLPAPNDSNLLRDDMYIAPRTPVEDRMAKILAPLLGLEKVSIGDNFFMLGGHSLLGTQLIARTRQVFGVELSLRSLFESPTIAELAQKVEERLYVRLAEMSEEDASQFLKEIEAFDRINAE